MKIIIREFGTIQEIYGKTNNVVAVDAVHLVDINSVNVFRKLLYGLGVAVAAGGVAIAGRRLFGFGKEDLQEFKKKLETPEDLTIGDLRKLRKVFIQVKYGKSIPTEEIPIKQSKPPVYEYTNIGVIMERNDQLKYGRGKKAGNMLEEKEAEGRKGKSKKAGNMLKEKESKGKKFRNRKTLLEEKEIESVQ
jgi:hypothetical protein